MTSLLLILAGVMGTVQYQDHQAIKRNYAETSQRIYSVETVQQSHETKLNYLYKNGNYGYKKVENNSSAIPNGNPFESIQ